MHYILSISLFAMIIVTSKLKSFVRMWHIYLLLGVLGMISFLKYYPYPSHAFGMKDNWNFLYELKASDVIQKQNISGFNVVHQGYDTIATVQKYLLKKNNLQINYDDYYNNEYLFIISNRRMYMDDKAYEVAFFQPSIEVNSWKINDVYTLYLRKRDTSL